MPTIDAILESALYVEDLPRSREFYEQVMGFERLAEDGHFVAYAAGPNVLLLFTRGQADHWVATPNGAIPPHDAAGHQHLAFAVPAGELENWEARLSGAGVELESRMRWQPGGASLFFRDPDGHLLELATPGLWRNQPDGTGGEKVRTEE
jgi:catechol 2,3-dioxygenase-like lactoylglutathione lyase family enzyme